MKLPKKILPKRIIFMVKAEAVENINKNSGKKSEVVVKKNLSEEI